MKYIVICFLCLSICQASAKEFTAIMDDVNNSIDQVCELHQDADSVLSRLGDNLVDRVNARVSSILDAYQLDCLSDLLKLTNLGIPGFGDIIDLDFCQIVRSEILSSGFSGVNIANLSEDERNELMATILARHNQRESFIEDMRGSKEG